MGGGPTTKFPPYFGSPRPVRICHTFFFIFGGITPFFFTYIAQKVLLFAFVCIRYFVMGDLIARFRPVKPRCAVFGAFFVVCLSLLRYRLALGAVGCKQRGICRNTPN
ncbi:hypothetical protein F4861DRAFT_218117 [Xylaria intraflava]|nr:hypothetical protein F4861DRAFT_218117 [Xylaria intraflava]